MFNRLTLAARQARAEQRLKTALDAAGIPLSAATIRLIPEGETVRASIVLSEDAPVTEADTDALEKRLAEAADLARVTVILTAHASSPSPSPQPSAQSPRSGHDNPLALSARKGPPEREKTRPANCDRVIAIASGKGGVGKSTVTAHLALALAAQGQRVGILDLDIYGPSVPTLFGQEGARLQTADGQILPLQAAGLSLVSIGFLVDPEKSVAWRGPMVMGAAKQLLTEVAWPPLDYLLIDTPPGTGDAHLTLLQRTVLDGAVIVTTPSPLALADVRRGASLFKKMGVPILGLIENMSALPDGTQLFGPLLTDDQLGALDLTRLAAIPADPGLATPIGAAAPKEPHPGFAPLADHLVNDLHAA